MQGSHATAIRITLPIDSPESWIYDSQMIVDWTSIALIQKHPDANTESDESVERFEITTLNQLDCIIETLKLYRSLYT